jgi:RNA polymerase sigma factor (sigma-70 family)
MAIKQLDNVVKHLRRAALEPEGLSDQQLLDGFLGQHDETAFEVLLDRHGPMVWGVCRRILRNDADAEDAFQATFLVLLRKAVGLANRGAVGNWLYGVAYNTALKAKAMNLRRRVKERQAGENCRRHVAPEQDQLLQAVLDVEMHQLPDHYRTVIVLCDLEGQTVREAARQLRCPQGTVASRLARGRQMLARRLGRRGILAGGAAALAGSQELTAAEVPARVLLSTFQVALKVPLSSAAVAAAASQHVAALTEGVLKTMLIQRLKKLMLVCLVAGLLGGGGVLLQTSLPAPAAAQEKKEEKKSNPQLEVLWADLSSTDEGKAARALLGLAATPRETSAFLKEHLKPVKADSARVAHWMSRLDSAKFKERELAAQELEYLGKYIKAELEKAHAGNASEEAKVRIKHLLEKLPVDTKATPPAGPAAALNNARSVQVTNINGQVQIRIDGKLLDLTPPAPVVRPGPSRLWIRAVRAIAVLEHLGSPEAMELLRTLAAGEPDALPTIAARDALGRSKR